MSRLYDNPPTAYRQRKMASINTLYQQQLSEIFAFSQLTHKSHASESDYSNEVLASQWIKELEIEEEQKKLKREDDTMEQRKKDAEISRNISREDARRDLFLNQKSPFLFRKYMLDYYNRLTNEYLQSYPTLSDYQKRTIREESGREVNRIIHQCGKSGMPGDYDPFAEWKFDIPFDENGRKDGANLLRYTFGGPCSSWPGHNGYCWDGTYFDDRNCAHTGGGHVTFTRQPFKSLINPAT